MIKFNIISTISLIYAFVIQNFGPAFFVWPVILVRSNEFFTSVDSLLRIKPASFLSNFSTLLVDDSVTFVIFGVVLRYLYHQYSNTNVTHAIPMPTKITMKTPPMFWIEMPSDWSSTFSQVFLSFHQSSFSFSKYRLFSNWRILNEYHHWYNLMQKHILQINSYALLNWSLRGEPCWTAMAYGFLENSSPTTCRSQFVISKYRISVASPMNAKPVADVEFRTRSTAKWMEKIFLHLKRNIFHWIIS